MGERENHISVFLYGEKLGADRVPVVLWEATNKKKQTSITLFICECEDIMQQSKTSHNTAARIKAGNFSLSHLFYWQTIHINCQTTLRFPRAVEKELGDVDKKARFGVRLVGFFADTMPLFHNVSLFGFTRATVCWLFLR